MKVVYTADIHGNEKQYESLVQYALGAKADAVIIGGDIAPKGRSNNYVKMQRAFLQDRLPVLLSPLEDQVALYLMMGNDDVNVNSNLLENKFWHTLHGNRFPLTDDIDIVGYSYVPITPFSIKDWEKFDLSSVPEEYFDNFQETMLRNRLKGVVSKKKGFKPFTFGDDMSDSIERDLKDPLYLENVKKTVYVVHTPPFGTGLDQIMNGLHVGSYAWRDFIEANEPLLTLHGHIHETVAVSGRFMEEIGNTISIASGNHNEGDQLALVEFDPENPKEAVRKILNGVDPFIRYLSQ